MSWTVREAGVSNLKQYRQLPALHLKETRFHVVLDGTMAPPEAWRPPS
jgi:hypothetical protein